MPDLEDENLVQGKNEHAHAGDFTRHDSASPERQDGQSPEQRARVFQMKILKGYLRGAVKYLTDTEKGGVLMLNQIDDKTGLVKEVL
jgi:hypothetical protein